MEKEIPGLEEIEQKKKLMQKQNANKKQLLTQALAQKQNKTMQEATRLRQIEGELKHLDVSLALDVNRIRQRVSTIC